MHRGIISVDTGWKPGEVLNVIPSTPELLPLVPLERNSCFLMTGGGVDIYLEQCASVENEGVIEFSTDQGSKVLNISGNLLIAMNPILF